jgi:hypothetical protein
MDAVSLWLSTLRRFEYTRFVAVAALLALLATAAPVSAEAGSDRTSPEHAGRVGFDLLILRPLNLVTTAVSLVGAAIAYPVALPFGGQDHVVEYLVKNPVDRTFRRPLGDL